MSPSKQLFKPEYSVELFRIAQGDWYSAKELFAHIQDGRLENVAYLCQQASEKAIKAVLNHLRIPFPLVHELGTLVALLPDKDCPPNGFQLSQLNPFATVRRYEEGPIDLTKPEVEVCLDVTNAVLNWAQEYFK